MNLCESLYEMAIKNVTLIITNGLMGRHFQQIKKVVSLHCYFITVKSSLLFGALNIIMTL